MMKDTLRTVLAVPGVSGAEQQIAATLAELVRPYVDEISTDALGNLIAIKQGAEGSPRVMFSAHMDQIGYIVVDIDKNGFLYVHNVGGVRAATSSGKQVIFQNGTVGIVAQKPTKEAVQITDLYIDIGASSKEEALEKVNIGDTAVVACQIADMGDRVSAPTMDNRSACAVLVELLMALKAPHNTVIAVFSAQEEVGLRGARAAAYSQNPDIGIAIDVTIAADVPEYKPRSIIGLGKGPAIKIMDSSVIATPSVRDGMIAAAEAIGIPYQREVLAAGGTDAGAIQVTRSGIPAGTLSIPCRYVHSATETVSIRDMEQCVQLLAEYLKA